MKSSDRVDKRFAVQVAKRRASRGNDMRRRDPNFMFIFDVTMQHFRVKGQSALLWWSGTMMKTPGRSV